MAQTQAEIDLVAGSTVRAIVASIRQNCTLPSDVVLTGGSDAHVTAVADWIENPPEWIKATWADEARKIAPQRQREIDARFGAYFSTSSELGAYDKEAVRELGRHVI